MFSILSILCCWSPSRTKLPIPYKKTSRASIQESDRREEVDDQGDVKVGTNTQDQSDLEAGDTPSNEAGSQIRRVKIGAAAEHPQPASTSSGSTRQCQIPIAALSFEGVAFRFCVPGGIDR